MNRNIVQAQQTIYTAITMTASKRGQQVLANAAFYLGGQVWPSEPLTPEEAQSHHSIFAVNKYGQTTNLHGPVCFECHQRMNVSRVTSVRGIENVQVCLQCKPFEVC